MYKIVATKSQLESIGIDRDLTDVKANFIKYYSSGYVSVTVEPTAEAISILGDEAKLVEYDIPEQWLKVIKK